MKKVKQFIALSLLLITACNDDTAEQSTVLFITSSDVVDESVGTYSLEVTIDQALSTDIEIEVEISGTALLNGDYSITNSWPLTIEAGETSAIISVDIIDDALIETEEDDLVIKLTTATGAAVIGENAEFVLTITDDDTAPTDALQTDLWWTLNEGEDIDEVNLDLYYITNLVVEDGAVTDFTLYNASVNESGFESLQLTGDEPDGEYYIVVVYTSGSRDVDFTLSFNSDEIDNDLIEDTLLEEEEGYGIFYGPVNKSGSSFSRTRLPRVPLERILMK